MSEISKISSWGDTLFYLPFFHLFCRHRGDKVRRKIFLISRMTAYYVTILKESLLFLETPCIEAYIVFMESWWNRRNVRWDIPLLYHILCDLMIKRTSTAHSGDVIHTTSISISYPDTYDDITIISYSPVISEVCTCSRLYCKRDWGVQDTRYSESTSSISSVW